MKRTASLLVVAFTTTASAGIISYEATSFPEQEGWERSTYCTPERWIQDGWLYQHVEVGCGEHVQSDGRAHDADRRWRPLALEAMP